MSAYVPDDTDTIIITQFWHHTNQDDLERLGFRFHEQVTVPNGVGTRVTIPPGWSKKRISNVQIELCDDRGRERVTMSDHLEEPHNTYNGGVFLKHRFYVWDSLGEPEFHEKGFFARVRMNTGDKPITVYETEAINPTDWETLTFEERTEWLKLLEGECEAWLDQHYPDWRDPVAYWDDDETLGVS